MMKIPTTWNEFKQLPWWQKALLALPLVLVALIGVFFSMSTNLGGSVKEKVIKHHKNTVDSSIKENKDKIKELEKEREKIAIRRSDIKRKLEEINEESKEMEELVNNASDDELIDVYDELCRRAERQRRRNNS